MIQEDQGQCSSQTMNNFETYQQEQFLLHQQQIMRQQNSFSFPGGDHHQVVSPILQQQPWSSMSMQQFHVHDPFVLPQQQTSSSPYASLFNRSSRVPSLQFAYDHHHHGGSEQHLRIISDTLHQHGSFGGLQYQGGDVGKMSAQEIMEAKALAASKSHSEAERRRRERINNHLAKLRSLLPSTTKTDKASLLAEVIQHVKELKRQTSLISETCQVPTECDELTVDAANDDDEEEYGNGNGNKFILKASLCCDDRSDLLPELIKTLKALRLRTVKADITTLGGRVKNVLFIAGEDHDHEYCISSIQEALKAVMEKSVGDESASGNVKRQRTNIISISN
ncbi:unnamed protein product [Lathyrus sativus]|nr:unnamed protein product [Lathyrus sativus]